MIIVKLYGYRINHQIEDKTLSFIEQVMIDKLGYDFDDLIPLQITVNNELFKVKFNNIECGLLYITDEDTIDRETHILSTMIQKDESLDFVIVTNTLDVVIVFTDHNNRIMPQYIDLRNGYNKLELICGKIFMKNLISNRGVEYYD